MHGGQRRLTRKSKHRDWKLCQTRRVVGTPASQPGAEPGGRETQRKFQRQVSSPLVQQQALTVTTRHDNRGPVSEHACRCQACAGAQLHVTGTWNPRPVPDSDHGNGNLGRRWLQRRQGPGQPARGPAPHTRPTPRRGPASPGPDRQPWEQDAGLGSRTLFFSSLLSDV